jgi:hypothetical protein
MNIALTDKNEQVLAKDAKYGVYFCTECGELSFLRRPTNGDPHFYHSVYNQECSLSVKGKTSWDNTEIYDKSIELLQQNYPQRWINAIDNLNKYGFLCRLYGKEWALSPINYYINCHIEDIDESLFYEFIHIISGINTENAIKALKIYLLMPLLGDKNRQYLLENLYKRCARNKSLLEIMLDGSKNDILVKYKMYSYMNEKEQKEYLKSHKPSINYNDIDYTLDKDHIERYKYFLNKYKKDNLDEIFTQMIKFKMDFIRNKPENKLLRSIKHITENFFDDLYEYVYNVSCPNGT